MSETLTTSDHLTEQQRLTLEAAAFRKLVAHLQANADVQNIELMNLAGFCRNCLSKWYAAEADERDLSVDYDQVREAVYGMPYEQWKQQHQTPATPEQKAAYAARHADKG